MKVNFTVAGEPVGKGRPCFSTYGGHIHARTPQKTVVYENLIRLEYQRQCGRNRFPDTAMLRVHIKAFYSIPTSKSKKQKAAMAEGLIRPTKKPDLDNITKAVLDSLNGIAYHDDVQIVDATIQKWYSDQPRVEVEIEEIAQQPITAQEGV